MKIFENPNHMNMKQILKKKKSFKIETKITV